MTQVKLSSPVVRPQVYGSEQFLVGDSPELLLQIALCQLIVRLCETRIDLQGAAVVDNGFRKFLFLESAVSRGEEFQFSCVGI